VIAGGWIARAETQAVMAMLTDAGHQALFVGGCVRNSLLGVPVGDIDIATDALPDRVMALALAVGLKPVPTGIDHGTVTVVSHGLPHEVTTFRRDIDMDGRHAVVAFADSPQEDARRRDFTMNALYARADGSVVDPLGGMADLRARYVRFIGDAHARIGEDYLRILRFFRFHAWYGDAAQGMDAEALAAIADSLAGLAQLSRERVGKEVTKLLAAPDPVMAVAAMRTAGVLAAVLPGASDRALGPLVHLESQTATPPDGLTRLAAMIDPEKAETLRLSRADLRHLGLLRETATGMMPSHEMGYRLRDAARAAVLLRAAFLEEPVPQRDLDDIELGRQARFPVTAADLMPGLTGAALGVRLAELERQWIAGRFMQTRADLLD
jgi:poly(A) polymerase